MIEDPSEEVKECPECGSENITKHESRDQIICRECGCIFEPMDPETEKKFEKVHDGDSEEDE